MYGLLFKIDNVIGAVSNDYEAIKTLQFILGSTYMTSCINFDLVPTNPSEEINSNNYLEFGGSPKLTKKWIEQDQVLFNPYDKQTFLLRHNKPIPNSKKYTEFKSILKIIETLVSVKNHIRSSVQVHIDQKIAGIEVFKNLILSQTGADEFIDKVANAQITQLQNIVLVSDRSHSSIIKELMKIDFNDSECLDHVKDAVIAGFDNFKVSQESNAINKQIIFNIEKVVEKVTVK